MTKPLITLIVLALMSTKMHGQTQKGILKQSKKSVSSIASGERHRYTLELDKNQFAIVRVMQQGIDLMITTYDSKNNPIEDFDSPNGKNGAEIITIKSTDKGNYTFDIYPFDKNEPQGTYEIAVEKIKPAATTTQAKVDELFAAWDNNQSPGAAVVITKDGEIVHKKGYGLANVEYDIPISPQSVFHIASVSKQFTAFAILLLESEGKLSLDDDIRKHIPEVPEFGKKITLRHLATHTSGMRDQWELLNLAGWRYDDVITKDHILKMVARQKELNFSPGDEFSYCNTGFTLLAEVVSRVSGQTFAEYTKERIFKPLQMQSTLFYDDHETNVKNRAYSYHSTAGGLKKSNLNYANVGATSLFTTAEDLSKWTANFQNPKVGNIAIIERLNTQAILNNGKTFGGALGQFVNKYRGLNEIQHGGADAGYRSYLSRFPDQKVGIVVLSNSAEFNASKVAHQIADIYLEDELEKPAVTPQQPADEKPGFAVDPKILGAYVGGYQLRPGTVLQVTEHAGILSGQVTGQPALRLTAISNTEFEIARIGAKLTFNPLPDGTVTNVRLKQGENQIDAVRIIPFDKSTIKLNDYPGRYFSDELTTTYEIKAVGGKLIVQHYRMPDFELASDDSRDKFVHDGREFFFERDKNGNIAGLKVTTGRVRNLEFIKLD